MMELVPKYNFKEVLVKKNVTIESLNTLSSWPMDENSM